MELCSFWVINPADGQEGKPEPVKIILFENGDLNVISLSEDLDYRGAYKLPSGSYSFTGDAIKVEEADLGKIVPLTDNIHDDDAFRLSLISLAVINEREWDLFYANPMAWKSLRIVVVTFGHA